MSLKRQAGWLGHLGAIIRLVRVAAAHIIPVEDEKLQAAAQAFLRAVGEGGRAGTARSLAYSQHRERALRRRHCRDGGLFDWSSRLPRRTWAYSAEPRDIRRSGAWIYLSDLRLSFLRERGLPAGGSGGGSADQ